MTGKYYLAKEEFPNITRTGGYKEIPPGIIYKAAEEVGLLRTELPHIIITRGKEGVYYPPSKEGLLGLVLVPRRERKGAARETLRHELAHAKLGHKESREPGVVTRNELEVMRHLEGRISSSDLANLVVIIMQDFGFGRRKALSLVTKVSIELKVPKRTITYGRRLVERLVK